MITSASPASQTYMPLATADLTKSWNWINLHASLATRQ